MRPRLKIPFLLSLVIAAMLAVFPLDATAADPPDISPQLGFCLNSQVCVQPAFALTAVQFNLKTGDYKRVAMNIGYGLTYKTSVVNLGAAIYGGIGVSSDEPNAPQANFMLNVADIVAFGPGVQMLTDSVTGKKYYQGLFSVSLNYNLGASPTFLESSVHKSAASAASRAQPCAIGS